MCRSGFVYCSPGSWLVASGYSGETFSTFPRLSEERGEAEAELRLSPRGAFVINCSRAGTGRGEDWIYNIKHRPGAECRDGVLVTAPPHHRDILSTVHWYSWSLFPVGILKTCHFSGTFAPNFLCPILPLIPGSQASVL